MKHCNCSCDCKHLHHEAKYIHKEEKNDKGEVLFVINEFDGYHWYCDKCPNKYHEFKEKYSQCNANWVRENITMDCYEPTKTVKMLSEMNDLLNKLKDSIDKKN